MTTKVSGTLNQIAATLLSAFGAPLTGLFVFGAFCPWGNATVNFDVSPDTNFFKFFILLLFNSDKFDH